MYYDYPIRKKFEITIPGIIVNIFRFKIEIGKQILRYEQANMLDTLEFLQTKDQSGWIIKFINNRIKLNFRVRKGLDKLGKTILDTYFEGVFSTKRKGERSKRPNKFNADLTIVAEKLSIDPNTLLNNYTFEQFEWFINGIIFAMNEQTEEGRSKNDSLVMEKSVKSEEEIKAMLNKIPN